MSLGITGLSSVDLLSLIGTDTILRRAASTNGGEYCGPCPFCGGRDRFRVWPQHPTGRGRWWCRQCEQSGDAIDYVRELDGLSFAGALTHLGLKRGAGVGAQRHRCTVRPPTQTAAPGGAWQGRAAAFTEQCTSALWRPDSARALAYLHRRGLTNETITSARLGYNSRNHRVPCEAWGLERDQHTRGVWLPRGIVIPWWIDGQIWRVDIRRPEGDPKYLAVKGSRNAMYNADALAPSRPAILVEGVFDALSISQEAGDLVVPVAGSTGGGRQVPWIARLAVCPLVLLSLDADEAGDKAAAFWACVLVNAIRWRPYWADANGMATEGVDIRAWIAAGIRSVPEPVDTTSAAAIQLSAPHIPAVGGPGKSHDDGDGEPNTKLYQASAPDMPLLAENGGVRSITQSPADPIGGWPDDPPPVRPCQPFGCGRHTQFWRRPGGGWVCTVCHPPALGSLVDSWSLESGE